MDPKATMLEPSIKLLISIGIVLYLCIWFLKSLTRQSKFRSIPGPPSQSWIMGNLGQLFNAKGLPFHQGLVDQFGGMVKVYGFFGDEQLYISDPRALQSIISKDQDAFEETAVFTETNKAIFGPGLVATTGEQHKRQRKSIIPIFSVGHLRELTPIFYDISDKLVEVLTGEVRNFSGDGKEGVLDMSEWMSRVALESVGQTVLGYSFDPLSSPHNNPYTSAVKELIPTIFSLSLVRQFAPFLSKLGPPSFRRKLVEWTPHKAVQRVKEISDVMHETAQSILQQKRNQLEKEQITTESACRGKDLISVLLRANTKLPDDEKMSDLELTGQMTVLIFGAQDTTSSALSRTLHMLSGRPDIQQKVRDEVKDALRRKRESNGYSGRLSYDEIMALPWLDAILKETMRLYPPVPFVRRTAIKERVISYNSCGSSQDSSSTVSTVSIPVGTTIFIGIAGSNRLESVWGPDAKEWKPERWFSGTDSTTINDDKYPRLPGLYGGTMSFLGGGRSCVGYKFAQVEMKIILATLLSKFSLTPTKDEIIWNLSQIISPSVRRSIANGNGVETQEKKGLPLVIQIVDQTLN